MSATDSAEVALHEFVDVEIHVEGLDNPKQEKAVRMALEDLDGVQQVRFDGGNISISYEPVRVTKAEIEEYLRGAGFQAVELAVASASPVLDATAAEMKSASERSL
jgi:hypothetical protein